MKEQISGRKSYFIMIQEFKNSKPIQGIQVIQEQWPT